MLHLSVPSKPSFRNYIYNKSPSFIAFFSSIDYKVYAVSWLTIRSVIPEKFSLPEPTSWWELTRITSTSSLWLSLFEYIMNGKLLNTFMTFYSELETQQCQFDSVLCRASRELHAWRGNSIHLRDDNCRGRGQSANFIGFYWAGS